MEQRQGPLLQAVEDSAILLTAQQGSPDPSSLMRDHPGTLLPELAGSSPDYTQTRGDLRTSTHLLGTTSGRPESAPGSSAT